jgi:hypothetical protein
MKHRVKFEICRIQGSHNSYFWRIAEKQIQRIFGKKTMMKLLLACAFGCVLSVMSLSAQQVLWARQGMDAGESSAYGNGSDQAGNLYVAGAITAPTTFGTITLNSAGGDRDCFVAKYSRTGVIRWAIAFGGSGVDEALDITTDRFGNSFVTGRVGDNATIGTTTFSSPHTWNFFITKIDSGGTVLWTRFFDNSAGLSEGKAVAVDQNGTVVAVTGFFRYSADIDGIFLTGDYEDVFTLRMDAMTGQTAWGNYGGGSSDDEGQGVTIDPSGNVITSGYYKVNAIFGTDTLDWSGDHDIFMVKYDVAGNILWVKNAMGPGHDDGYRVIADNHGNIYLEGIFQNTVDFWGNFRTSNGGFDGFLAKFDGLGNMIWLITDGGFGTDYFISFAFDYAGFIYISGTVDGTVQLGGITVNAMGNDIILCKLDTAGNFINVENYGGAGSDIGHDLVYVPECFISIAGSFEGNASFDSHTLNSGGLTDACAIMIDATCLTSIGENEISVFDIYPNPTRSLLNIQMNYPEDALLNIFNTVGQTVLTENISSRVTSIDINHLTPGIYLASLTMKGATHQRKILIE